MFTADWVEGPHGTIAVNGTVLLVDLIELLTSSTQLDQFG